MSVNPWNSESIIKSIKTKHKLYKGWKNSINKKDTNGDPVKYSLYKNYRKSLKYIIKNVKKQYYGKQFDESKGNIKKTWNLINALRGKHKESISHLHLL